MADFSNENIRWSIKWALCNCWCVFTWKLSCCIQPQWTQSGCQTLLLLELWAWKHKLKENTKLFNCYISRNVNYLWLLSVFHWEHHVVLKYFVWYWTEFNWSGCQLPVYHILETDFRSSVFAVDANSFLLEPSSFGTWQKIIWTVWRLFCSCFTLGLLGRLIAIISSLLSWSKKLDLEVCHPSLLQFARSVIHESRRSVREAQSQLGTAVKAKINSAISHNFRTLLPWERNGGKSRWLNWVLKKRCFKVCNGTGSCNWLNTSDYRSNHSNSCETCLLQPV